ncbi:AAA family ATPase [Deferrisoma sp.]
MIARLQVSNYRSMGPKVFVDPGRLSVFIGPNGSGKSNLLDVLAFVRDSITQGLPAAITHRGGIDNIRRRSSGHPFDVRVALTITLGQGPASYEFVVGGDRVEEYRVKSESARIHVGSQYWEFDRKYDRWPPGMRPRLDEQSLALTALGGTEQFKPLADFLASMSVYSIFPDQLRVPQRFDPTFPMQRHGENWVSVLRDLIRDPQAKEELIKGLNKLTGDIEDVQVRSAAGHLIAEFKQRKVKGEKSKRWFEAAQQSDGTLRVAGILTALLQEPRLPVIGVEEPELTVHPGALPLIYDYLRQASEVSQVLVTTHSPHLLDLLDPERDVIYLVQAVEGKTEVRRLSEKELEPVRTSLFRLGDLFLTGALQLDLFEDAASG